MYERRTWDAGGATTRFRSQRAGILLDGVVALGLILLGAYVLYRLGFGFHMILDGARRFFER